MNSELLAHNFWGLVQATLAVLKDAIKIDKVAHALHFHNFIKIIFQNYELNSKKFCLKNYPHFKWIIFQTLKEL